MGRQIGNHLSCTKLLIVPHNGQKLTEEFLEKLC